MDELISIMHPFARGLLVACLSFAVAIFLSDWIFGRSETEEDKTDAG